MLLGALAGALAAVGAALHWSGAVIAAFLWLAAINVGLALFNVLPGAPLDGGRLLRATLWKWRGDRVWATIVAARCGRALGVALVVLGALEFVRVRGDSSGLWLAVVGWFVMDSARSEEEQQTNLAELAGVRVGDVMTAAPDASSPDITVAEFRDTHPLYGHSTVPLVVGDRPVGLVTLDRLHTVPAGARSTTTLRALSRPMSDVPVAERRELVADLLPRLNRAPDHRALVTDDGVLVGIIGPVDITRAVEQRQVDRSSSAGSRLADVDGRHPGTSETSLQ